MTVERRADVAAGEVQFAAFLDLSDLNIDRSGQLVDYGGPPCVSVILLLTLIVPLLSRSPLMFLAPPFPALTWMTPSAAFVSVPPRLSVSVQVLLVDSSRITP